MDQVNTATLALQKVTSIINAAVKADGIYCIGVDGPTASGKTVFADILNSALTKKCEKKIQIVTLDSLLIDRSLRENSLLNITSCAVPFEHEAE